MEIEEIQENYTREEYEIGFHAEKERYAEDITIQDLETAIYNGEILEDYPEDPRGPSCLVLDYAQNRPIHIVCGYTLTKWIRIITVYGALVYKRSIYIPKSPKWIDERTRARGGEKSA